MCESFAAELICFACINLVHTSVSQQVGQRAVFEWTIEE